MLGDVCYAYRRGALINRYTEKIYPGPGLALIVFTESLAIYKARLYALSHLSLTCEANKIDIIILTYFINKDIEDYNN